MADLDRLEVQVEASAAKANAELDKMLGKLDKIVSSLSAFKLGKSVNIDAELKNVADSMEKVKQSVKGIASPKMDISQIEQTVSSLREQFKNIGKDFRFTGNAEQAEKEIADLQSRLEKLREREDKAITLGKVDTVSFKSLQYDIALTTNKLSVLQERLRELSKIGQPKFDFDMTEINRRVEELREKFKDIGKDYEFKGNVDQFYEALDAARGRLDELEQRNFQLLISGKVDEELQQEIVKTINMLDSLEQKRDEFASAPRIEIMGGYEDLSASINDFMRSVEEAGNIDKDFREKFENNLRGLKIPEINETSLDKLKSSLDKREADLERFRTKLENDITMGRISEDINDSGYRKAREQIVLAEKEIVALRERIQETESQAGQAGGFQVLQKMLSGLISVGNAAGNVLAGLGSAGNALRNSFSSLVTRMKKVTSGMASLALKAKKLKDFMLGLGRANKKNDASFANSLKTILKYTLGIRSLYVLINRIRRAIIGGYENLARYSDQVNTSISGMSSALLRLKNAFAAAFAPIVNIVAPYITAFINMISDALNTVGRFFAALTGKTFAVQATKVYKDYAKGLSGVADSAKDAQKALSVLGFDQLNQLQDSGADNSGGGSGSGEISPADMFTDVPIESAISEWAGRIRAAFLAGEWEELGAVIAEGINVGLQKIYDAIRWENGGPKITSFIEAFSRTFNSIVDHIEWDLMGRVIGAGINTMVNSFNLLVGPGGIDFENIGKKLSVGFRGMLDEVEWTNLGNAIGNKFMISWRIFDGLVTEMWESNDAGLTGWSQLGISIAESLNGIFQQINFGQIGSSLGNAITGIFQSAIDFAGEFDWWVLGFKIGNGINEFLRSFDAQTVAAGASEVIKGILDLLIEAVQTTDWGLLGEKIGTFLAELDFLEIGAKIGHAIWEAINAGIIAWENSFSAAPIETAILSAVAFLAFTGIGKAIALKVAGAIATAFADTSVIAILQAGIQGLLGNSAAGALSFMNPVAVFVTGIVSSIAGIAIAVSSFFSMWKKGFSWLKEAFMGIGLAIAAVGAVILGAPALVAAAVAGVVAAIATVAIVIHDHWEEIVQFFTESIPRFWSEKIAPWFTLEKWKELLSPIKIAVVQIWDETVGQWGKDISAWWSQHVSPWFTLEKWKSIYGIIKTSLKTKWDETVEQWKSGIGNWWSQHVVPWFAIEKWKSKLQNIVTSFSSGWSEVVKNWKSNISNWWKNHVEPWFTMDRWINALSGIKEGFKTSFKNAANAAIDVVNRLIRYLNEKLNISWDGFTLPNGDTIGGFALQLFKMSEIPHFASGGYPETGQLFLARENGINEMIGRIGSRSAVANNDQIVEAVSSGVAGAVADVMMAFMGQSSDGAAPVLEFTLKTDSETLYRAVLKGKEKYDRRWHVAAEI